MRRAPAAIAMLFAAAGPAPAADLLSLEQPVACTLGTDCYIQNHFDGDPGPGARDFRCAGLTYDGHKGTDFALPTRAALAAAVTVRAAAAGRILSLRDGMENGEYLSDPALVKGRECGNGVVIGHGDGWQTQYCHMEKGSLTVTKGQQVAAGDPLGTIGMSGKTAFPHLHFALHHDGQPVDPFNADGATTCAAPLRSLWKNTPAYVPTGFLAAGFAPAIPQYDAVKSGTAAAATLPADAPGLVLWGYAFGGQRGDTMIFEIDGPAGFRHDRRITLEKGGALYFRATGRKHRSDWAAGQYTGRITLMRAGRTLSHTSTSLTIRP